MEGFEAGEYGTTEGESPVQIFKDKYICIPSSIGHVESGVNLREPPRKAKYSVVIDSVKYREGMVKRTPVRGVKQTMKSFVYKQ